MKLEFEEQDFEIYAQTPEETLPHRSSVRGLVCGHFGIFKTGEKLHSFWSVTHLPSGRRAFAAAHEAGARQIIAVLLEIEFPWEKSRFSPGEKALLVNVINREWLPLFERNGWIADFDGGQRIEQVAA